MSQNKNASGASMRINIERNVLRSNKEKASQQLSDEILATQVARGESAALEALYDRHASIVLGIALKVIGDQGLAEDVLQETFWRVWRGASAFQPKRGSFTSWLFRVARNPAIDAYRRRNVRPQTTFGADDTESILDKTPDPDANVAEQTQALLKNQQVQKALTSLPQVQRQVIEMAYFYGMTRRVIAQTHGDATWAIASRRP